jgi:hypothetical protein
MNEHPEPVRSLNRNEIPIASPLEKAGNHRGQREADLEKSPGLDGQRNADLRTEQDRPRSRWAIVVTVIVLLAAVVAASYCYFRIMAPFETSCFD